MLKLSIRQHLGQVDGKEVLKTKTFSKIQDGAADAKLKAFAEGVATLLKGENADILKIETTSLRK